MFPLSLRTAISWTFQGHSNGKGKLNTYAHSPNTHKKSPARTTKEIRGFYGLFFFKYPSVLRELFFSLPFVCFPCSRVGHPSLTEFRVYLFIFIREERKRGQKTYKTVRRSLPLPRRQRECPTALDRTSSSSLAAMRGSMGRNVCT